MSELGTGAVVAGYRIEGVLGRGGMGVVYRASDERLGRSVALKVIAPEQARDEAFRHRFIAESRAAAAIDHPNVLPVYEAGEHEGLLFLVTRLVEGHDLADVLRAGGPLEPKRAVELVKQVGAALDAAHAHGLVHRDVKPANVLVAQVTGHEGAEHCYLTDFGLAKRDDATGGLTATGQFVGTLDYVAPEQIHGGEIDGRADGYALGALLFQCLTGDPPFRRDSAPALMFAHMNEPPPRLSERRPGLPERLDEVVVQAMAKEPGERFASCAELAGSARAALEGRPAPPTRPAARPPSPAKPAATPPPPAAAPSDRARPRRRTWPLALAALALIAAAGTVAWLLLGSSDEPAVDRARLAVGDETWSASTGGPVLSTPAVSGRDVIVGSDDGSIYSFDARRGRERWRTATDGPVRSSPLVANGTAYVGSFDGNVYALRAGNGRERWAVPTGFEVFSSPAIAGGTVAVGAEGVLALDAGTGAERWRFDTGGAVNSSPAIVGGVVYAGADDGALHAIDLEDGGERWSLELSAEPVNSSPAVAGGTVYIGSEEGLHAVDAASGDELWRLDVPAGINSSPAVGSGTVFVGTRDGSVLAVEERSGAERWRFRAGGAVDSSPAVAGGVVYIGSNDGTVYGLDADSGADRWRFDAGAQVIATPAVSGETAYVTTDGGELFAVPLGAGGG